MARCTVTLMLCAWVAVWTSSHAAYYNGPLNTVVHDELAVIDSLVGKLPKLADLRADQKFARALSKYGARIRRENRTRRCLAR